MIAPKIVPVPEKMQKFYGSGTMLHPELSMVETEIAQIPAGKVLTLDALTERLSRKYGTDVTCPLRTSNHLKRLSKTETKLPFWRVVKRNGHLIKFDDMTRWAAVLEKEGFTLSFPKKDEVGVRIQSHQRY